MNVVLLLFAFLCAIFGIISPAQASPTPELDPGTLAALGSGMTGLLIAGQLYMARKNR